MTPDIKSVQYLAEYRLKLSFDDGVEGEVDLKPHVVGRGGIFLPLEEPAFFSRVTVNPDIGTIVWPNDADLSPEFLYELLSKAHRATQRRATA